MRFPCFIFSFLFSPLPLDREFSPPVLVFIFSSGRQENSERVIEAKIYGCMDGCKMCGPKFSRLCVRPANDGRFSSSKGWMYGWSLGW